MKASFCMLSAAVVVCVAHAAALAQYSGGAGGVSRPVSPRISPEQLENFRHAFEPPKIDFSKMPVEAPGWRERFARPEPTPGQREPFALPSWLRWEWLAGIFVLSLLAGLLRGCFERKKTVH